MDHDAAIAEAERLNASHPDRERFEWVVLPREEGAWAVVKAPRGKRIDPLKATTEAKPKPPEADDPRPAIFRNLPPYGLA